MRLNEYKRKYMEERNRLIYSQAKIGEMTFVELAKIHRLKESAIRKIVGEQKKKEEAIDK